MLIDTLLYKVGIAVKKTFFTFLSLCTVLLNTVDDFPLIGWKSWFEEVHMCLLLSQVNENINELKITAYCFHYGTSCDQSIVHSFKVLPRVNNINLSRRRPSICPCS